MASIAPREAVGSLLSPRIILAVYLSVMVNNSSSKTGRSRSSMAARSKKLDPRCVDTAALRALLKALSDAALALDLTASPDQAAKISTAMINLTKTIRETETYNQQFDGSDASAASSASLEERLKGYHPSQAELAEIDARLKLRLERLLPRLMEGK